ncbi:MAG: hypothetical protein A2790_23420 [Phenylobacterium sp. RIFCSPHIGHO2_01_FULL_69_31]|uniref:hypothetical protein n=1 Tax=Phenylobacterium sp. RIFCSPHIGHO2_01_FULL_69_31 TaxID=1801944 RepID=UPI0008B5B57E|nr:hypothetical protein [Phenylobacterium sp. RIFCSPHIGHO2_01_FULL_69_31]OHB30655.1 MAG: hypothetical protein A2790_23420 [Phenylobacterium sp. RIFCSPHIGHO2_01_FULL_69_31]
MTAPNATTDPGFFDGRYMVEITDWNWGLHVGLSHDTTPVEYRFQGGLAYARSIEMAARVRAPSTHRGKLMRIWISPFGPEVSFGSDGLDDVGRFYERSGDAYGSDFELSLHLPESALGPAVTCLSSVWKYLDIWTVDDPKDRASVTAFSFSASIHPNLIDWAGEPLEAR